MTIEEKKQLTIGEEQVVWVENRAQDGKFYYYNAKTRESSWTKPNGTHIKIIRQEDLERITKDSLINKVNSISHPNTSTNDLINKPASVTPTFSPLIPPPTFTPYMPPPPIFPTPPHLQTPHGFSMLPPPNAFGVMPPPSVIVPQVSIEEKMRPLKGLYDDETYLKIKECEEKLMQVKAECAFYPEYETPERKKYYYNQRTQETTWEKPKCYMEQVELEKQLSVLKKKKLERPLQPEVELTEEEKAKQKSKPVSSTAVSGTPWCVVWTRDGRVFYYNPSEKISSWERPFILQGRDDVDKMVNEPPLGVEIQSSKISTNSHLAKKDSFSATIKKRIVNETSSNTIDTESEVPPIKKSKNVDGTLLAGQEMDMDDSNHSSSSIEKRTIEASKEAAIEAELKAARERAQTPLEQRIKIFREMLVEKEVSAFSTWEKELHKIVFDSRYLLLTSKERKQTFEKYIRERADEERKEKAALIKKKRDDFREMLKDAQVHQRSHFSDFAQKFMRDERYKAIEKMKERESLFNEYLYDLKRQEKDDRYTEKDRLKRDYYQMLKEIKHLNRYSSWSETKRQLESDARYRAIESSTKREDYFRDYTSTLDDDEKERKEKQDRVEASLKEREKEVREQMSKINTECNVEREKLKHDESVECFKALMLDLIRQTDFDWKEAKRELKRDSRYGYCSSLTKDEKEKLYDEHVLVLRTKKKDQFFQLLNETHGVTLSSTWKEVKKLLKSDVRFDKLTQQADLKLDKEFDTYIHEKYLQAKHDFKELLADCKIITYKSLSIIQETPQHLKDIEEILSKDKAYIVLECASDERKKILMEYIEALDKEGPPPPPTATEPNRRK